MNRIELFRNPPPDGWYPADGERVVVCAPHRRMVGTVRRALLLDLFEVELRFGSRSRAELFLRDQLRPVRGDV